MVRLPIRCETVIEPMQTDARHGQVYFESFGLREVKLFSRYWELFSLSSRFPSKGYRYIFFPGFATGGEDNQLEIKKSRKG